MRRVIARLCGIGFNLHRVNAELYRSAQIFGRWHDVLLPAFGVRGVLNLRGENPNAGWWQGEKAACNRLGIGHDEHALHSRRLPERADLIGLLDKAAALPRPLLVKCAGGADRSSLACALILLDRGFPLSVAMRQLSVWPGLHLPGQNQRWIRAFFTWFAMDADGVNLRQWLETRYSAAAFAEWLAEQQMADAYKPFI